MTPEMLVNRCDAGSGRWAQWPQLIVLTFIHFAIDSYMGMIPALMPSIIRHFGITVIQSVALMIAPSLLVNLVQVAVGHTRAGKTLPLMIYLGGALTICGGAIGLVAVGGSAYGWLMVLFCLSAVGVGLVHPECFRAVHGLEQVSPSTSTAVFMTGGQLGYGLGAWLTAAIVVRLGFGGLWWLAPAVGLMLVLTLVMRVRLAVEPVGPVAEKAGADGTVRRRLSFWPIWLMSLPAALMLTVFLNLLPQRLTALGFALDFGGYCHWLFMGGSVVGLLFWSALSNRFNTILCMAVAFGIGSPVLAVYAHWETQAWAAWLLAVAGFSLMAPFTLMVKEARFCRGLNLGGRMALAAGGTWGFSNLGFLAASYGFKQYGSEAALIQYGIHYSWVAGLVSALLSFWVWRRTCSPI